MHLTHKQIGITLRIVISQRVLIITNDITRVVTRVFSPNIRYWQYRVHIIPSGPGVHGPLGTLTGSSELVKDFHSSDSVWSEVFRVSWCSPVPNFHFLTLIPWSAVIMPVREIRVLRFSLENWFWVFREGTRESYFVFFWKIFIYGFRFLILSVALWICLLFRRCTALCRVHGYVNLPLKVSH